MDVRTEDNCRIGDSKVMTNSKGAPMHVANSLLVSCPRGPATPICTKTFFPVF